MTDELKFIGLDTCYPTAYGTVRRRIHLDGAASPLACETGIAAAQQLLPHYSNSHSYVHTSAQISTRALAWARHKILELIGADTECYTAIFIGSGCTAGINRIARGLASARAGKSVVLVSSMEHHANDLPHRQHGNKVEYIPLVGHGADAGGVDIRAFEQLCRTHSQSLNYVAVSSVSNVTGIHNEISEITKIAHRYGGLVLVDGAQSVAHSATNLSKLGQPDFFVFSGHKLYTPAGPGVLIANKSALSSMDQQDMGGGSVAHVDFHNYELSPHYPEKEESGTPNIVGAYALAKTMQSLDEYGFENIEHHGQTLIKQLLAGLTAIKGMTVYGDLNAPRSAALAFNHIDFDHGLLAAILNDYYAIAVRNECFCAHPYVSGLLKEQLWELDLDNIAEDQQEAYVNRKRGMLRASISLYNTPDDISYLLDSLNDIISKQSDYKSEYHIRDDGSYQHNSFKTDWHALMGD